MRRNLPLDHQSLKKGYIQMAVCTVLWSSGGLLIKMLEWNPFVIAGLRSLIACCVFLAAMKGRVKVSRSTVMGGLFLCYLLTAFVIANKMTTAANAIVMQSTSPMFIILIETLVFHRRYRRIDYIAVAVTMLGILLFFVDEISGGQLAGNLLALSSGVAMAAMYLYNSRSGSEQESMSSLFLGHLFTGLAGLPFLFTTSPVMDGRHIAVILALGLFQLGIPYVLYGHASQVLPVLTCSLIGLLEPLLNPIWVALAVGEVPGPFALLGAAVVLGAVTLWSLEGHRHHTEALPAAGKGSV